MLIAGTEWCSVCGVDIKPRSSVVYVKGDVAHPRCAPDLRRDDEMPDTLRFTRDEDEPPTLKMEARDGKGKQNR